MTVCTRCIMDSTDPDISFDAEGVCNHCHRYDSVSKTRLIPVEERDERLKALIDEIKAAGDGKSYDCVIGVSGGVDSTYVAWLVKKLGLRPLAVHLDNGWNSELAVRQHREDTQQAWHRSLHSRTQLGGVQEPAIFLSQGIDARWRSPHRSRHFRAAL